MKNRINQCSITIALGASDSLRTIVYMFSYICLRTRFLKTELKTHCNVEKYDRRNDT